ELHGARTDEEVIAVWTGEFLPEDIYEDWTTPTREEVRSRFGLAARRLAQQALDTGDHERTMTLSRQLLALGTYDTAAHELRLRALLAAGAHPEARRAYEVWREVADELGVPVPHVAGLTGPAG